MEERKIPVFTVLKNGTILKNIFVINKPPEPMTNPISAVQETEEILIVGRHPDCHIVLMHPSISRFHLQINSNPFSHKLFLTDLSSVHGTWVSEKKIEPGIQVELNEGDTIKIGGSTRVYRLHWVPLSRAYDMENPFVSPLDLAMLQEKELEMLKEEHELEISQVSPLMLKEEHELEISQDIDLVSAENGEIQTLDSILEDIDSLFFDGDHGLIVDKEIPPAPIIPEDVVPSFCLGVDKDEMENPSKIDHEVGEVLNLGACKRVLFEPENQQFDELNHIPKHCSVEEAIPERENMGISAIRPELEFSVAVSLDSSLSFRDVESESESKILEKPEDKSLVMEGITQMDNSPVGKNSSNMSLSGYFSETNHQNFNGESQSPEALVALQPLLEKANQENSPANQSLNSLISPHNIACSSGKVMTEILEVANESPSGKENEKSELAAVYSAGLGAESVSSSMPLGNVLFEIIDSKASKTPLSVFAAIENLENSKNCRTKSLKSSRNIWSRRGKPDTALQLQTNKSRQNVKSADVDAESEYENRESIENRSIVKALFSGSEAMEDEVLTPGKENYSPNSLLLKSLKRKSKIEENHNSKTRSSCLSKGSSGPDVYLEEDAFVSSDKENCTPIVLKQRIPERPTLKDRVRGEREMMLKERREERMPLQTLLVNSPGKSISEALVLNTASRSGVSLNCTQTMQKINVLEEGKKRWTMVVDTGSLLDKQSWRSLQLLQGLKGTHLIIPRMVIRELDCLKRRGSLFKRTTEASLVLDWIEECMVKTEWWIHVQSSVEEGRPIAPTPPASPQSRFIEGSGWFPCGTTSSAPLSARGSLLEIISPTSEDHILDYALFNRRMHNEGQLVLISNDTTLKIKAMAEGLVCETAKEFRDSLVNPFSERFPWADSSPRGLTWSVLDDVILKEKYYKSPSKKPSKGEGAKGLKLILLHNAHYGAGTGRG